LLRPCSILIKGASCKAGESRSNGRHQTMER